MTIEKRKCTATETGQTPAPTKRIRTQRGMEDIMVASEIDNAGPQNEGLDQQQQQRASSGTVTEVVITGGREDHQQESPTSRRSGDVKDCMTSTPLPPPNQDGITTMDDNTCNKCRDLTDLKPAQIHVYHRLHTVIDGDQPRVILLDTPSGTGKTRIISTLARNYGDRIPFAVFHRAYASEIYAITHAAYMMRIFNLTFKELRSFTVENNIEALRKFLIAAQEYKSKYPSTRAIIVDDCSVMNPLMVVALYFISLMNKITLIFSGNRMQLGYINKTKLHCRNYKDNDLKRIYFDFKGSDGRSNFDVLELISDPKITQEFTRTLIENYRSSDQGFLEKVQRFGNAVTRYKITERAPFHFNLRYLLYTLFREKFDPTLEDSSDNLIMAQFHNVITNRMENKMRMEKEDGKKRIAPFDRVQFNTNPTNKFLPGLILCQGMKFIYCRKEGVEEFVELVDMKCDEKTGDLTELTVKFENGNSDCINRDDLNFYQILYDYRDWLMEHMEYSDNTNICNFPLKQYTMTYQAVLGRTIRYPVELSIERNFDEPEKDFSDATAVYVGLCSLTSESNIKKIHTEQNLLDSFSLTDHMSAMDNQEYYYRCNKLNGRENIRYTEVYTIREFEEDTPEFKKIKRSVYETNMRKEDMNADSLLMKITKFVRDDTATVRNVITKIGNSGLDDVMTALSEAYDAWESKCNVVPTSSYGI